MRRHLLLPPLSLLLLLFAALAGCSADALEAPPDGKVSCLTHVGVCTEWDDGAPGETCGTIGGQPWQPGPGPCPAGAERACRVGAHQVVYYYAGGWPPPESCVPAETP